MPDKSYSFEICCVFRKQLGKNFRHKSLSNICNEMDLLIKFASEHAQMMMQGRIDPIPIVYVLLSGAGNGTSVPIMVPLIDAVREHEQEFASVIAKIVNEAPTEAYYVFFESWLKLLDIDGKIERKGECVVLLCHQPKTTVTKIFEIHRDSENKVVKLTPSTNDIFEDESNFSSYNPLFSNFYERIGTVH